MAEKELDLFEVSTVLAAEFGAGAAQVVGAEVFDADLFRRLLDHTPHRPVAQFLSDDASAFIDRAQQVPGAVPGLSRPSVDQLLDPQGHGHGTNAAAFAAQIGDHTAALALLNILHIERGQLGTA